MSSEEKILKLINFEATPETKAEAINYLQSLRRFKKEVLKKNSSQLENEFNNLEQETIQLAYGNYATFIKTAESSRQVLKGWNETSKNLDCLIEELPTFSEKCDVFIKSTLSIQSSSRLNSLTLKKYQEILEILELPQLMESSLRDEKYEDALELASYVQMLGMKHKSIPVVNNIVKIIESSWQVMISQLLSELKNDLTLPKCLQIVGYLKRMQAFSPTELKLKFLQTRDCWLKSILPVTKTDNYQYLAKTIELTRVNLFNIVTQYKALFEDDLSKESYSKTSLIFYSWINEKIDDFLRMLENQLNNLNATLVDISSILGQCMYFGVSFSRIGVDFRAQLTHIFMKTITKYLNGSVIEATKQFERGMEQFTLINKDVSGFRKHSNESGSNTNMEKDKATIIPPEKLLDFHPLAAYCNALLNIFNELRVFVPVSLLNPFVLSLEVSLENVSRAILSFYKSEQQALGKNERECFLKMCSCFVFELVPYIQNCVNLIFANNRLNLNVESLTIFKSENIFEPLKHLPDQFVLLPAKQ
ncbi:CLUMA_CG015074, isoform A [Clunio marinus]|uniref:Conserved oligomeric Golgi complex subunit 8 n=1 Tax=Clunio marinus TaxID=568069 RepID=A0A1J1IQK4_9DIPT|nr:CLUMA_CG015074, isoform A [Clunio marinus]